MKVKRGSNTGATRLKTAAVLDTDEMEAFDNLPADLRAILRDLPMKTQATWVKRELRWISPERMARYLTTEFRADLRADHERAYRDIDLGSF